MSADWATCRACHDLDADCAACWAHDLLAIINPESEG